MKTKLNYSIGPSGLTLSVPGRNKGNLLDNELFGF